jgi:Glycosyl hydrolase family 12
MSRVRILLPSVLAGSAVIGLLVATPAGAASSAQPRHHKIIVRKMCRRYGHRAVQSRGAWYIVKNELFTPGERECIVNRGDGPNFTIASVQGPHTIPGESRAYPNIFTGCSYDLCSAHSRLPAQVSSLTRLTTSWYTSTTGVPGHWDAGYDIWLSKLDHKGGQDQAGELMLWLSTGRFPAPRSRIYRIDGIRWYLRWWETRDPYATTKPARRQHWPLIIFRAVHPRQSVRNINILPFISVMERKGVLHRNDWITSIHAGFEIWSGGRGLSTKWFMTDPVRGWPRAVGREPS